MTPADVGLSTFEDARIPTSKETLFVDHLLDSQNLGERNISNVHDHIAKLKRARKHVKERRKIIKEAEEQREKTKKEEKRARDEDVTKDFQTIVIVAALIATITFAAAFAIPGGYDGNQGRHQGLAVLAKTVAFKAFVVTNTIAVVCSVTSIFLCFTAMFYTDQPDIENFVGNRFGSAMILILVAMFAMMLAYIAAAFAVLAHSIALAVSICIIACITFIIVYFFEITKCWFTFNVQTSQALAV